MLADFDAEGPPLLRVLDRRVAAGTNQPGRAGRHGEPALIEREHRDFEPLAEPTDEIRLWDFHGVHGEPTGIARENAPFLGHWPARKPLETTLHDERAQASRVALPYH